MLTVAARWFMTIVPVTEPAVRAKTHVALRRRSGGVMKAQSVIVRFACATRNGSPCPRPPLSHKSRTEEPCRGLAPVLVIRLRVNRSTRPEHAHVHTSRETEVRTRRAGVLCTCSTVHLTPPTPHPTPPNPIATPPPLSCGKELRSPGAGARSTSCTSTCSQRRSR